MSGYLEGISGKIPHTHHKVDIQLDGKNLILTGGNGCGKTSLLNQIRDELSLTLTYDELEYEIIRHEITTLERLLIGSESSDHRYNRIQKKLHGLEKQLYSKKNSKISLKMSRTDEYIYMFGKKTSIFNSFDAHRQANIETPAGVSSLKKRKPNKNSPFGSRFEEHLLYLRTKMSFAVTEEFDSGVSRDLQWWFDEFDKDLCVLMEDPSTHLHFDVDKMRFFIKQVNKPSFSFQTLSSGYSAIFNILAELIMRSEYFEIPKDQLTGIVLIDEIDVHLHVSLQRKILPFLTRSFPKLQFIVTTHSPFVITSVSDTVIYDLSKHEQISNDLTMYSYEAVVEGLLGVPPVSTELRKELDDLVGLIDGGSKNKNKIQRVVNKLSAVEDKLDEESLFIYEKAAYFLLKLRNAELENN